MRWMLLLFLLALPGTAWTLDDPGKAEAAGETGLLRFAEEGVRFRYPLTASISVEKAPEVVAVTLEDEPFLPLMIQRYPDSRNREDVLQLLVKSFAGAYLAREARLLAESGSEAVRTIAGRERRGRLLKWSFLDRPMAVELYAFQHGPDVLAVVLQYELEKQRLSEEHWGPVLETLDLG